eukprot:COSAG04_NODE_16337_length_502_cov_1.531017_1_plen_104_part_01
MLGAMVKEELEGAVDGAATATSAAPCSEPAGEGVRGAGGGGSGGSDDSDGSSGGSPPPPEPEPEPEPQPEPETTKSGTESSQPLPPKVLATPELIVQSAVRDGV